MPDNILIKKTLLHCLLASCVLLCVHSLELKAKQLKFNKTPRQNSYSFDYTWLDHRKKEQTLTFNLPTEALFERFRNVKTYKASFAQKSILRNLKMRVSKEPISGVQVLFKHKNNQISIEVKGADKTKRALAYQKLTKLQQEITTQYFADNYLQHFSDHEQVAGVKVNHVLIANVSVADLKPLKPLILKEVSIKDIRKVTNYVLSFVQTIPYSRLTDRKSSSGAGFNPPLKVLWENQGDCDSKMTLTAALLRSLMPRIEMVFIYIKQHAFIGIAIPAKPTEVSINHQGMTYLLAEPTGPMLLPLGKLSPESELSINQGHYIVEKYHAN